MKINYSCAAVVALGLALFLSSGCAKSYSNNIGTGEFFATYLIAGNSSNHVDCEATFTVGGSLGTYIELVDNDRVYCSDGIRQIELTKSEAFNVVRYTGSGLVHEPGRTYSMLFTRGGGQDFTSSVILPSPMAIFSPSSGVTVVKGAELPVAWNAGNGDEVKLSLQYSASGTTGSESSGIHNATDRDDGSYIFTSNQTRITTPGTVSSWLEITRVKRGSHTTGLKGGSIQATQEASVALYLVD